MSAVTRAAFDEAFDAAFGPNAHTHVSMDCRSGFLTEMQIALPKEIGLSTKLDEALPSAGTLKRGSCGRQFFIDAAGLGTP